MYLPRKTIDHAHNDYLEMLVELGIPGTLLLAGGLASCWLASLHRLRRVQDPRRRGLAVGCLLGAGAVLLHATVDFPLRIPALAALVATLLGCASGLTDQPSRQTTPRFRGLVALALALAGGIILTAGLKARQRNPEESFANGHGSFLTGNLTDASQHLRDALTGNPYAAPVWMQLAELAETRGEAQEAALYARIAEDLEPHSFRISWPAAELFLRRGNRAEAVRRFAQIARSLPEMRPAIYHSCWAGGVELETIAVTIVPPEGAAVGEYLVFLVQRGQWSEIVPAYERLAIHPKLDVPVDLMQYVSDRLLETGREFEMKALWKLVAPQSSASTFGRHRKQRSARGNAAEGF
jgi:tetratricopeptide (TPR) repeat protein